ncbi:MAG: hypothetical protein HKN43_08235 [Rhodothermales bacterium]|nr:hypothetical protein [Rhodothermales bacterium]
MKQEGVVFLLMMCAVWFTSSLGCSSANSDSRAMTDTLITGVSLEIENLNNYGSLQIPDPGWFLVKDDSSMAALSRKYINAFTYNPETKQSTRQTVGPVDFDSSMIVVASFGSTGCAISEPVEFLNSPIIARDSLFLRVGKPVSNIAPPANEICSPAVDYRVHAVTLPRFDGPVKLYSIMKNGPVLPRLQEPLLK